jgi:hypothetical protein
MLGFFVSFVLVCSKVTLAHAFIHGHYLYYKESKNCLISYNLFVWLVVAAKYCWLDASGWFVL